MRRTGYKRVRFRRQHQVALRGQGGLLRGGPHVDLRRPVARRAACAVHVSAGEGGRRRSCRREARPRRYRQRRGRAVVRARRRRRGVGHTQTVARPARQTSSAAAAAAAVVTVATATATLRRRRRRRGERLCAHRRATNPCHRPHARSRRRRWRRRSGCGDAPPCLPLLLRLLLHRRLGGPLAVVLLRRRPPLSVRVRRVVLAETPLVLHLRRVPPLRRRPRLRLLHLRSGCLDDGRGRLHGRSERLDAHPTLHAVGGRRRAGGEETGCDGDGGPDAGVGGGAAGGGALWHEDGSLADLLLLLVLARVLHTLDIVVEPVPVPPVRLLRAPRHLRVDVRTEGALRHLLLVRLALHAGKPLLPLAHPRHAPLGQRTRVASVAAAAAAGGAAAAAAAARGGHRLEAALTHLLLLLLAAQLLQQSLAAALLLEEAWTHRVVELLVGEVHLLQEGVFVLL
eukprot:Rhum_TRINITY_DN13118_c1_g2::Rhum_TRINITY_DN13118_c1_g2_i1::g.57320::m.57320